MIQRDSEKDRSWPFTTAERWWEFEFPKYTNEKWNQTLLVSRSYAESLSTIHNKESLVSIWRFVPKISWETWYLHVFLDGEGGWQNQRKSNATFADLILTLHPDTYYLNPGRTKQYLEIRQTDDRHFFWEVAWKPPIDKSADATR